MSFPQTIFLEANLTQANANDEGKTPDINWSYIVKHRNEPLPPPSKAKKLEGITSHSNNNKIISFDINSKFTYPTEETTDCLKEHHQLIIFAYRTSPAYKTQHGTTHIVLDIVSYPIVTIRGNTIAFLMEDKQREYTLIQSCEINYLRQNIQENQAYNIILDTNNPHTLIILHNSNEIASITHTTRNKKGEIFVESKDIDEIKNLLGLSPQTNQVSVYVDVKWKITLDMLKEVFEITEETNEYDRKKTILEAIVEELNSNDESNNQPMYMTYKLNTRERLEHFFAQCVAEVGGSKFKLGEGLWYSVIGLINTHDYYKCTFTETKESGKIKVTYYPNKDRIKEALNDGGATKAKHYNVKNILKQGDSKVFNKSIKLLIQEDYINDWLDTTNNAISQVANITEIIKNMTDTEKTNKTTKKPFTDDELKNLIKDYTPIELIETIAFYRKDVVNIKLAFAHGKVSVDKGKQYEIPFSSESNKAFTIITQAVFDSLVKKRKDDKKSLEANKETIANKVYADINRDKYHKLGNINKGDGYRFRGRGMIQLTGRSNYAKFQDNYNQNHLDDNETEKDFLSDSQASNTAREAIGSRKPKNTNGRIAILSAVWFWNKNKLYNKADTHNDSSIDSKVQEITKIVNGGTNGLKKRQEAFKRIRFGSEWEKIQNKDKGIFRDFPSKINHKL
ncbi:glycoside hydrolase family 19 protein [Helicobacter didelphidarum]|uniref:glycoside hydrolase family 19 protein n=1 Tax=Helicobacter didelphidarum TaxID=2040648 RepID=UPI001C6967A1|nr:hypothetical protein [Helicobacter didelphidarum]